MGFDRPSGGPDRPRPPVVPLDLPRRSPVRDVPSIPIFSTGRPFSTRPPDNPDRLIPPDFGPAESTIDATPEPPPAPGPAEHKPVRTVGGFVERLADSGRDAVIWFGIETVADVVVAGLGTVAKAVHVGVQTVRALRTFNQADGLEVQIPLVGLGDVGGIDIAVRLFEENGPDHPVFGAGVSESWPGAGLLNSFTVDGAAHRPDTMLVAGHGDETYQATANVMQLAELAARMDPAGPPAPFFAGCIDRRRHRGHLAVFMDGPPAYLDIHLRPRSARHGPDCRCPRCVQREAANRTTMQPLLFMESQQHYKG